ncbi:MAG: hypothetical protein QOH70_401 [Blastocatellia bacterium]|jgi:hypothetical protein|nr:hypothetical protein [Blastocatellia bacterium]
MLIKIGNKILNTGTITDAKFIEKGDRAILILRYAVVTKTGGPARTRIVDDHARAVWDLLCDEAHDLTDD